MALQYQSSLTGPEIDVALEDMAAHNSEAWAVGARDGVAVGSTDITYHNNAEYYAESANAAAARAEAAVPSGTAGAVFFDRSQTLTEAQQEQARTNIGAQENAGGVLQITPFIAIGQARIPPLRNAVVGWYRIASIDIAGTPNTVYKQVFIMGSGAYSSGTPTVFSLVASLPTFDTYTHVRVSQLSGFVGQNYTRIRFVHDGNLMHIDIYLATGGSGSRGAQVFHISSIGGKLITYEPTAPLDTEPTNVAIDYELQTTINGAFGGSVLATPAIVSVASIAALKTQLSAWRTAQGSTSVGFYVVRFSAAASPFVAGARVNVQLNVAEGANGVATLTTYGSSNPEMYLMRLFNGTWGDPKKVTVAS